MGSFFSLKNKSVSFFMKKFLLIISVLMLSILTVINPISVKSTQSKFCSVMAAAEFPNVKSIVKTLFGKKVSKPVSKGCICFLSVDDCRLRSRPHICRRRRVVL